MSRREKSIIAILWLAAIFSLALAARSDAAVTNGVKVVNNKGQVVRREQGWINRSPLRFPSMTVRVRRGCHSNDGFYNGSWTICVDSPYADGFFHELFHLLDDRTDDSIYLDNYMQDIAPDPAMERVRVGFRAIYNKPTIPWTESWMVRGACSETDCMASLQEWFAEGASICAANPESRWRYESTRLWGASYSYPANSRRWLSYCRLLKTEMPNVRLHG